MIRDFALASDAVDFLCQGLRQQPAGEYADLVSYPDGSNRASGVLVDLDTLCDTLQECCEGFRGGTAVLLPLGGVVPIGAVQCSCRNGCGCVSHTDCERWVVCVMLCPADRPPVDETRRAVLDLVYQVIQDDKASRDRREGQGQLHKIL